MPHLKNVREEQSCCILFYLFHFEAKAYRLFEIYQALHQQILQLFLHLSQNKEKSNYHLCCLLE